MSVYTSVSLDDLQPLLERYDLGAVEHLEGIQEGMENTNYRLFTSRGGFVLTLFERHTIDQLPFYLELMASLNRAGVSCAHPVVDSRSEVLYRLHGKPAALFHLLPGHWLNAPGLSQLEQLGQALGRMHCCSIGCTDAPENDWGLSRWLSEADASLPVLDSGSVRLLQDELAFQQSIKQQVTSLPVGIIHADLFRDNVLFENGCLSGMIDFYMACRGPFLYDLAVVANDWCVDQSGQLIEARLHALFKGYQSQRKILPVEIDLWPTQLRAAALRFWLSRLREHRLARSGDMALLKDPDQFKHQLQLRVQRVMSLSKLLA